MEVAKKEIAKNDTLDALDAADESLVDKLTDEEVDKMLLEEDLDGDEEKGNSTAIETVDEGNSTNTE